MNIPLSEIVRWDTLPIVLLTLAVAIVGVARFTRVVVYDDFPPLTWWRETWADLVGERWGKLFNCWWCFAFWAALACIGWYIGGLYAAWAMWAWWIWWGGLALAYLASMVIVRDGDEDD